jgi:hypothetical protein
MSSAAMHRPSALPASCPDRPEASSGAAELRRETFSDGGFADSPLAFLLILPC